MVPFTCSQIPQKENKEIFAFLEGGEESRYYLWTPGFSTLIIPSIVDKCLKLWEGLKIDIPHSKIVIFL
jgi:hypothetical protein